MRKGAPDGALRREVAALRGEIGSLRRELLRIEATLGDRLRDLTKAKAGGAAGQDPEVFFQELVRAHARRATPLGTAAVPQLREDLCQALNISPVAFDEALTQCWLKGLVSLEAGNPIGAAPGGHLEYRGKKFYYVRLP